MSKSATWTEFSDPRRAAAVVAAAETAGWKRGRILDFLGVGDSTLRTWAKDGEIEQLSAKKAIRVEKLARKVGS